MSISPGSFATKSRSAAPSRRGLSLVCLMRSTRVAATRCCLHLADSRNPPARRFHRSVLPHAGAFRRALRQRDHDVLPERLEGKKIAVIAGSAHEAFLKAMFTEAEVRPYPDAAAAREALAQEDVDLVFGDGFTLAFWLHGANSAGAALSAAARFWRAAISAKGSALRSNAATIFCAWRSIGRCSRCGKRAPSPTYGCAIFRSVHFDVKVRTR